MTSMLARIDAGPEQRGTPLVSGAHVSAKEVHAGRQADAGDDDLATVAAQIPQAHPDLAVDAELLGRQYSSVDPAVNPNRILLEIEASAEVDLTVGLELQVGRGHRDRQQ